MQSPRLPCSRTSAAPGQHHFKWWQMRGSFWGGRTSQPAIRMQPAKLFQRLRSTSKKPEPPTVRSKLATSSRRSWDGNRSGPGCFVSRASIETKPASSALPVHPGAAFTGRAAHAPRIRRALDIVFMCSLNPAGNGHVPWCHAPNAAALMEHAPRGHPALDIVDICALNPAKNGHVPWCHAPNAAALMEHAPRGHPALDIVGMCPLNPAKNGHVPL